MVGNEHRRMAATQRLLDRLRNFVQQGGPDTRTNVRSYLRMCLKAEELRQQGWQATVRGKRRRWVVVIKGKQAPEKLGHHASGIRSIRARSRRKTFVRFYRSRP
jgi:hypothetical protein